MPDQSHSHHRNPSPSVDDLLNQTERDFKELNASAEKLEQELKRRGPGRVTAENLVELFTYHPPEDDETRQKYERIRQGAYLFAAEILGNTPGCADQQAAIRKVREAMMTANAAIATKGMC